jgi:hypothetical protein
MKEIVFFLEERSAEVFLAAVLPQLLPADVSYRCVVFEGKSDLEKLLVKRMKGYRNRDARFLILRDQDLGDCRKIKDGLLDKCDEAGQPKAVVRIACHELESWYLADLAAVETGLARKGLRQLQLKRKYRAPDSLPYPSKELVRLAPSYQKIAGARLIAPHLDLENQRSSSFACFIKAVIGMAKAFTSAHDSH